jgi:hypothetical protein
MFAGCVAIVKDFVLKNGQVVFGATFFFIGLGIGGTLLIWNKVFGAKLVGTP